MAKLRSLSKVAPCALVFVAAVGAQTVPTKAYSVCDVVGLSTTLAGKTILVRGLLGGTAQHGYMLYQGLADDPCPGWPRRYFTAPSAILLSFSLPEDDGAARTSAVLPCVRAYQAKGNKRLAAEIEGTLVKKRWFPIIFRRPDGAYYGLYHSGFGQFGGFPLMLEVRAAKCGD
jgi:hypothetical protein